MKNSQNTNLIIEICLVKVYYMFIKPFSTYKDGNKICLMIPIMEAKGKIKDQTY